MTEIPEHLLKRAKAAREKSESTGGDAAASGDDASRIPSELLERSKAARAGGVAVKDAPAA
ncbi:MAG: menaquinol-cytochrome c reductase cytochrome b subunit, partial [Actinomycetota bacterium]